MSNRNKIKNEMYKDIIISFQRNYYNNKTEKHFIVARAIINNKELYSTGITKEICFKNMRKTIDDYFFNEGLIINYKTENQIDNIDDEADIDYGA